MDTRINFINRAELTAGKLPTLLLFQKQADEHGERAVVWKVIRHCDYLHFHPMVFSSDIRVSIGDGLGNYSAPLRARRGEQFNVAFEGRRPRLSAVDGHRAGAGVTVHNDLATLPHPGLAHSFDACLFMRDQLLANSRHVAQGASAHLSLEHTLWVAVARRSAHDEPLGMHWPGVTRPAREGDPVTEPVLEAAHPMPLRGLASANIVMYGNASQLTFRLESAVEA